MKLRQGQHPLQPASLRPHEWDSDLPWLAGLIEGEGTIWIGQQSRGNRQPAVKLVIGMTDRDVIERVAALLKTGLSVRRDSPRPVYTTSLSRREDLRIILPALLPFMGERRAIKIRQALDLLATLDQEVAA